MDRFCLIDAQWATMQSHCLGKPDDPGRTIYAAANLG